MSGIVIDDRGYQRYNLNDLNIISGFNLSCMHQPIVVICLVAIYDSDPFIKVHCKNKIWYLSTK